MAGESNVQASSPLEMKSLGPLDQKLAMAKRCGHEGVVAGTRAAVVATVASAIPTLASVRMLPWARRNLNPTAQALIVSLVAFVVGLFQGCKSVPCTDFIRRKYKKPF